jgi:hypothetical protein
MIQVLKLSFVPIFTILVHYAGYGASVCTHNFLIAAFQKDDFIIGAFFQYAGQSQHCLMKLLFLSEGSAGGQRTCDNPPIGHDRSSFTIVVF